MTTATTDILVVNFRCTEDTIAAVERLQPWTAGTIWVVDNSAAEAEWTTQTQALRDFCASQQQVRMLDSGGNIGFGRACNLAFEQSRAQYFLLLNPDARIQADDVKTMAALMAQHGQLGGLSPAVYWNAQHSFVMPMPSEQTPAAWFSTAMRTHIPSLARRLALRAVQRTQEQMAQDSLLASPFLAGAVLLLRRTAVIAAGGLFDPTYFMFFEDADLSLRLRRAGFSLAVAPQIRAVHAYRHKAYKESMMADSHAHYFAQNFPILDQMGGTLGRLRRWHKPIDLQRWFHVLDGKLAESADFTARTHGKAVLAWSPSLLMEPAACRTSTAAARCFDEAEWALLEPGAYVALMADEHRSLAPHWVYFEKS